MDSVISVLNMKLKSRQEDKHTEVKPESRSGNVSPEFPSQFQIQTFSSLPSQMLPLHLATLCAHSPAFCYQGSSK